MASNREDLYTEGDYRSAIRLKWLPLVGRKKLKSYEIKLCHQWHEEMVPVSLILRAIASAAAAAEKKGLPLTSLGFIRPDLERLKREDARTRVGAAEPPAKEDWRIRWAEDLEALAGEVEAIDIERAAMFRELIGHLPTLTLEEAQARLKAIN